MLQPELARKYQCNAIGFLALRILWEYRDVIDVIPLHQTILPKSVYEVSGLRPNDPSSGLTNAMREGPILETSLKNVLMQCWGPALQIIKN